MIANNVLIQSTSEAINNYFWPIILPFIAFRVLYIVKNFIIEKIKQIMFYGIPDVILKIAKFIESLIDIAKH